MRYAANRLPLFSSRVRSTLAIARSERKASSCAKAALGRVRLTRRMVDWNLRDSEYVKIISAKSARLTPQQRSSDTRILKAVGLPTFAILTSKGRLSQTEALLASIVRPHDLLETKREKLLMLVKENPSLGREALRQLDRTTVDGILAEDREFYNQVMPENRREISRIPLEIARAAEEVN